MPKRWTGEVPADVKARTGLCECGCGGVTALATFNYAAKGKYKGYPARFISGHQKRGERVVPVPEDVKARTGVCECGCGGTTEIAPITRVALNNYAGHPYRFIRGHQAPKAEAGTFTDDDGYVWIYMPKHPNANKSGTVAMHRYVMSEALGRPLLPGETVHHISTDKSDNGLGNLQLRRGHHGPGAAFQCGDCGGHNITAVPLAG